MGGYMVSCPLCRTPSIFAQSTKLSCSESPRMCDYNICVINHSNVTFCVVTPRCWRECGGDRFLNKPCTVERSSLWILCPAFQMLCAVCVPTFPKLQVIQFHWSARIEMALKMEHIWCSETKQRRSSLVKCEFVGSKTIQENTVYLFLSVE